MVSGQEARQGDGETGTSQGNMIKYDNLLLALCSRLFFFSSSFPPMSFLSQLFHCIWSFVRLCEFHIVLA